MEKKRLVVKLAADFDYLFPPRDMQESVSREQERHRIRAIAMSLESVIQASMEAILNEIERQNPEPTSHASEGCGE